MTPTSPASPTPDVTRPHDDDHTHGLPMPHERDQGASPATGHAGPGPTDPVIEQAHRDLAAGQVDTDLRAQPGLDAERRRAVAGETVPRKP